MAALATKPADEDAQPKITRLIVTDPVADALPSGQVVRRSGP